MPELARAVVFDLDDTLYPERRFVLSGHVAVAQAIAAETGMPVSVLFRFLARRFQRAGRDGLLQAFCAAHGLPLADVPRQVEIIRAHTPNLRLPRRSRAVLDGLRAQGYRLGVLTNGLPDTQRAKVAALGMTAHVDAVAYAHEHAPDGKPALAAFAAILRRLDMDARQVVFVGDHPEKDVAGAAAAGMRTIWLARPRSGPAPSAADAVARDIAEVPRLVARLLEDRHVA